MSSSSCAAAVLLGADVDQLAAAELVELVGLRCRGWSASVLLATQMTGLSTYRSRRATSSSSGIRPARVSTTNRITAADSMADVDLLVDLLR